MDKQLKTLLSLCDCQMKGRYDLYVPQEGTFIEMTDSRGKVTRTRPIERVEVEKDGTAEIVLGDDYERIPSSEMDNFQFKWYELEPVYQGWF